MGVTPVDVIAGEIRVGPDMHEAYESTKWKSDLTGLLDIPKDTLGCYPVCLTRIRDESGAGSDGKGNVRASADR